jgi:hypothetical protein
MYQFFNYQLRLPDRPIKRFAYHLTETLDEFLVGQFCRFGFACFDCPCVDKSKATCHRHEHHHHSSKTVNPTLPPKTKYIERRRSLGCLSNGAGRCILLILLMVTPPLTKILQLESLLPFFQKQDQSGGTLANVCAIR